MLIEQLTWNVPPKRIVLRIININIYVATFFLKAVTTQIQLYCEYHQG